ncbi:glycosyltransferase family 4 protein [Avibacterium avium]|uniref:glycosyltransferase family 4 protein n=1 Tax=Avibacterium avium TaxID=751 RepID=UPI003BF7AC81
MKICFLLWSPDISGGTNVIFQHAIRLQEKYNHNVYIVTHEEINHEQLNWFPEAKKLNWITYDKSSDIKFDICIATWWRTVFYLKYINSTHYVYFVQSIESRFYPDNEVVLRNLIELTYSLDLKIITEANWIKNYLKKNYDKDCYLVLNGINKANFSNNLVPFKERDERKIRVLVEGPLGVSFKNTELAISLAKKSLADEVWLLTSTDTIAYPGIDKLYSKIPHDEVGKVYSSCDILVKLSTVEGMFGPPLEAFHCGATSITYDVTGYDEYIIDKKNALVSFSRTDIDIIEKINLLVKNKALLKSLKKEALETAQKWPSWGASSEQFNKVCHLILNSGETQNIKLISKESELLWNMYENHINEINNINQTMKISLKRTISSKLAKYPKIFSITRKIYHTLRSYI